MIYLVGGAPRAGKSILGQRVAARLRVGWGATDVLASLLQGERASEWDASPAKILATAEWFFPHLERFVFGVSSLADDYLVEGVHFLPKQVAELSRRYEIRSVFLGNSRMTVEQLSDLPGRSRGYAGLPIELKRQIARDVPAWSDLIARQAADFGCPYMDTSDDFASRLNDAEHRLTAIP